MAIVREFDQWRRGQPGKPSRGAIRDYWKQRDQKHGQRPDYLLWRQMLCAESPLERRHDPVELALRALRAPDPLIHWAALSLVPSLLQAGPPLPAARREELVKALRARLGGAQRPPAPLPGAPHSCALIVWLCRAAAGEETAVLLKELHALLSTTQPDWKLGRSADLGFLRSECWLPVPPAQGVRWLAAAIARLIRQAAVSPQAAAWHLTAWMLLRDARPPQSAPRADELEMLLDAAGTARLAGDPHEAARLTALALHLLPPQAPEPLLQRCRAAAWTLAEAGLAAPPSLRVSLDDMAFPGDLPASEKGQEAARLYHDAADASRQSLAEEVAYDPDWQRLRDAGVVLHHPLAALAWIGRKAQSHVVKKQHELLNAANALATRHHCLSTTGRILAQAPVSPETVLAYAQTLRQSLRRMPLLRDAVVWQDWTANLRAAWGRLEADAIHDPESVFLLHETLLDREVTTLRCLPMELRLQALRHLHSRRSPSALVQELESDPRQMQQIEHQRAVELWSIATEMRERPDQAHTVWVSLVLRGDAGAGRYSLLVQGAGGRVQVQGRLRSDKQTLDFKPLLHEMVTAVAKVCESPEWVLLALDDALKDQPWAALLHEAGLTVSLAFIPGWEWAFRVLRETPSLEAIPSETLLPEGAQAPAAFPAALPQTCVLLDGPATADAETRWTLVGNAPAPDARAQTRRSLSIGAFPRVISLGPLKSGPLSVDLARLSLAQSSRCVIAPAHSPAPTERTRLEAQLLQAPAAVPLPDRLRSLMRAQPQAWTLHGLP